MRKVILKAIEFLTRAKVHADHTAIMGNKSNGKTDQSGYKHWRALSGDVS